VCGPIQGYFEYIIDNTSTVMLSCTKRSFTAHRCHARLQHPFKAPTRSKHSLLNPRRGRPILAIESSCDDTGTFKIPADYSCHLTFNRVFGAVVRVSLLLLFTALGSSLLASTDSSELVFFDSLWLSRCYRDIRPSSTWRDRFEAGRHSPALESMYRFCFLRCPLNVFLTLVHRVLFLI